MGNVVHARLKENVFSHYVSFRVPFLTLHKPICFARYPQLLRLTESVIHLHCDRYRS